MFGFVLSATFKILWACVYLCFALPRAFMRGYKSVVKSQGAAPPKPKQKPSTALVVQPYLRRFQHTATKRPIVVRTSVANVAYDSTTSVYRAQRNATPFRKQLPWRRYLRGISPTRTYASTTSSPVMVVSASQAHVDQFIAGAPAQAEATRQRYEIPRVVWDMHIANLSLADRREPLVLPSIVPIAAVADLTPQLPPPADR